MAEIQAASLVNSVAPDHRSELLPPLDTFPRRHLGPSTPEQAAMLELLGHPSIEALIDAALPPSIRLPAPLDLPAPLSESEMLRELREIASRNRIVRSFIGTGYADCITPPVIQRNILENPGWYTQYTPYQAEISQGRLEALLNFQTLVTDLTGMDIANASLLDEGTAAAEAMSLAFAVKGSPARNRFFVSAACHPQTIAVVRGRAAPLGVEVSVGDHQQIQFGEEMFGVLLQYPATDGTIYDYTAVADAAHAAGCLVVVAADILSLTLLRPPAEFGADVAVGSTQRFGVPLGFGGPHAAFFATRDAFKRQMPGRLVGLSRDAEGSPALRLALQTREQHIRRDKATSNICTAQVLLAVIASMYAVYHGPDGLRRIARRVRLLARLLEHNLRSLGFETGSEPFFDTLRVETAGPKADSLLRAAAQRGINLRKLDDQTLGISLDETTTERDLRDLLAVFGHRDPQSIDFTTQAASLEAEYAPPHRRDSDFLTHPVFNRHHTETELLRYMRRLESRDLSLTTSMIPLGSCTMKLNATAEMIPVTWPEFGRLHPFAPTEQTEGYQVLFRQLELWLAEITGFAAVSLQPNAGSQGEYAGLMVIREYHARRGEGHRNICLIPLSAHGTNPASAVMCGLKVVAVACDSQGNIDVADLKAKASQHAGQLAALMVTYPSTHGVFETTIREICEVIHAHGGQVYMDGANMNAQVGLTSPGVIGADVCHLNLHKTFCIPHGGGGPGMGPIGVASHLAPFLPGHPLAATGGERGIPPISAAPWGSASILVISWAYIRMMGAAGLTEATRIAILNANYIARRLESHFPVLYRGPNGLVAHECIVDVRSWKQAGIEVEDIAKRLIDYGFHAPTVSWPVPGTIMIEPTESESKEELDRFCDAMIAIHGEMEAVASGTADRADNVLKNAPHTARAVTAEAWNHPYSRETAVFPAAWTREHKFWPAVARIDNVYGDRNLVCACPPVEAFTG